MKHLFLISFICLISGRLTAQFVPPCPDPNLVSPTYMCNDPFYNPVCGCDKKTYRNSCNALHVHGVTTWLSGVCSGLDVDIYPNPVLFYEPFTVNLSYPENVMGNATLYISDMYGKIWAQRIINNFNRTQIQFEVSGLTTGVYLLVVQGSVGNGVQVRKFSKN